MSMAPDRITKLRESLSVTGIDFIFIHQNQVQLDIHFYKFDIPDDPISPVLIKDLLIDLVSSDIRIYNEEGIAPEIEVLSVSWTADHVLSADLNNPGDFTLYKIYINDRKLSSDPYRIDPYYNNVTFNFKANCPSDLDCKPKEHECPPEELNDFPIDYLARDFWSYRTALFDFASLRYPDWADRLEADAGVMMVELMSALGDEMAYYQDRVSREAYLETATQRRSIRRHARLVDYHMHDGLGATVWIDFTIDAAIHTVPLVLPNVTNIFSVSDDNTRIDFEIGQGFDKSGETYTVSETANKFEPHLWDEDDTCLPVGSTELYITGHQKEYLAFDDLPKDKQPGKWVLIKTNPTDPEQAQQVQLVRLIEVTDTTDPIFNANITHLVWEVEQALKNEFDLTILTVRGNMVPATAGKTHSAYFIVDDALANLTPTEIAGFNNSPSGETVNRSGHDDTAIHLYTLPDSQSVPLVYFKNEKHQFNDPEIILEEVVFDTTTNKWIAKPFTEPWIYTNALVGVNSSKPTDKHFTLDDGTWQRVVGYQRIGREIEHLDYAMNAGVTIRFGDEEFGRIPDKGSVFRVRYRLGGSRRSNVAAHTLTNISPAIAGVKVTNPLPSTGGMDPETPSELRQLSSDAFRAITYRAVRPEDYAEAAERLPWVQKAGSVFRWTGSWLTAFVTPDPKSAVYLESEKRIDLSNQMNRFRQAGRETNVMDPVYASMDLEIEICVAGDAYSGQVKEWVMIALMGKKGLRPKAGYFSPDRFTFGTVLERSTLEAAIQDVPGVKAIEKIHFGRRGWFGKRVFTELSYDPGRDAIIRIANDPLHPEQGTLKLYTHGGL